MNLPKVALSLSGNAQVPLSFSFYFRFIFIFIFFIFPRQCKFSLASVRGRGSIVWSRVSWPSQLKKKKNFFSENHPSTPRWLCPSNILDNTSVRPSESGGRHCFLSNSHALSQSISSLSLCFPLLMCLSRFILFVCHSLFVSYLWLFVVLFLPFVFRLSSSLFCSLLNTLRKMVLENSFI